MREKEPSTRVIYMRHGQTDFPSNRIYCDDVEDPSLNTAGLAQAKASAEWLKGVPVDHVFASPSLRTRMTAQEIVAATNAPLTFCEPLKERRFGVWDGLFFEEIERKYPDDYAAWKRDQAGYTPAGGETIYDLRERVSSVVQDICVEHKGRTIVVVSHVGPIRVCVADAMKMPVELYRQLTIDYAALTRVDYGRSQNNLLYLNLGPGLSVR